MATSNNKTTKAKTKKPDYVKTSKADYDRWDNSGAGVAAPTKKYVPKKGK